MVLTRRPDLEPPLGKLRGAAFFDEGAGYDVFGLHLPSVATALAVTRPIHDHYFRVRSVGADHIPTAGAALLVANHGGVLPVDAAMLWIDVLQRTQPPRILRLIEDRFVPLMPFVSTFGSRVGAVSGTPANVRRLLERGELVAIFPEGTTGPAKPRRARYQLQAWRVGHAELALRYGAPIIPVAIVGAEESWPLLARLPVRLFGAPYLPLPLSPLPLPVRYDIEYGDPIRPASAGDPAASDDPALVQATAAEVHAAVEALIARVRARRRRPR